MKKRAVSKPPISCDNPAAAKPHCHRPLSDFMECTGAQPDNHNLDMRKPTYKTVHLIVAGLMAGITIAILVWRPALTINAPNTVSSIGSFVTLYGVLFAIIELIRVRSATEMAIKEGERIYGQMQRATIRDRAARLRANVELAIDCIERNKQIPALTMNTIIEIYSEIFHKEMEAPNSEHRKNQGYFENYRFTKAVHGQPKPTYDQTSKALLKVTGQLSVVIVQSNLLSELQK